ncbi:MAG: YncE family protein [Vicinamibacterales bacterium]
MPHPSVRALPGLASTVALTLALSAVPAPVGAQLAVSSNDHKTSWVNGLITPVERPSPDTATIVDLGAVPPRVVATLDVPGGVAGPPQAVVLTPDEGLALVTSSSRVDPARPGQTLPNDVVSVIDLQAAPPRVVATLHVGGQAGGIAINRAGSLALVGTRRGGGVAVLGITGRTVRLLGTVSICDDGCDPSTPGFTPDGRTALVTRYNDHKVAILRVEGTEVQYTGSDISANLKPYPMAMSPVRNLAVVSNVGNGLVGGADTLSVIDLDARVPRVASTASVLPLPEGLAFSPDGTYVAAASMNGSNAPPTSPLFNDFGVLSVFRLEDTTLTRVAEARIGHWCEGIAWNRAADVLVVQCAEQELQVFRFDGRTLTPAGAVPVGGVPTGIGTARP